MHRLHVGASALRWSRRLEHITYDQLQMFLQRFALLHAESFTAAHARLTRRLELDAGKFRAPVCSDAPLSLRRATALTDRMSFHSSHVWGPTCAADMSSICSLITRARTAPTAQRVS